MLDVIKKIVSYLKIPITFLQVPLLYISYYFFKVFKKKNIKRTWVIGVDEIASIIFFLKDVLNPSISVCLSKNTFYNRNYNYSININNIYLRYFFRLFYAPLLLGYLVNKSTHFWYIWNSGFLFDRNYEFKFLKSKNIKIITLFCGDDIRSVKLTNAYAKKNQIDTHTHYQIYENKYMQTDSYDSEKKKLAKSAEKYADIVFNYKMCQISYLSCRQFPFPYLFAKNNFFKNIEKYDNLDCIKILHAPSSVLFKGTSLVRAAIKKLEIAGYNIEYIELQNTPNNLILEYLKSSHIVLNQFYAFTPGYLGIEAMANYCAVLMSADPSIETSLPQNINDAWMITKYWEVYDNLKYLLDNPKRIKYFANNGYEFAINHYTYEVAGEYINKVLKENNVI
jgi:hypothetical protein